MQYKELKNHSVFYYPAVLLEELVPERVRRAILNALGVFILLLCALLLIGFLGTHISFIKTIVGGWGVFLLMHIDVVLGLLALSFALWTIVFAVNAFFFSYYFHGTGTLLPEEGEPLGEQIISFEVAYAVFLASAGDDIVGGFVRSPAGRAVLTRFGISRKEAEEFLRGRGRAGIDSAAARPRPDFLIVEKVLLTEPVRLADLATALIRLDVGFTQFLASHSVSPLQFKHAAEFVERRFERIEREERWWGRDRLGRISGIGKRWAYGGAFRLERYATDIVATRAPLLDPASGALGKEVVELEATLSRARERNALLVGDGTVALMEPILTLAAKIRNGSALPPLQHKRVFIFDPNAFISATKTKSVFESEFIRLLEEAGAAGDVVLVLPEIASFIASAHALGSDVISVADSYLRGPELQVIATVGAGTYHDSLERDGRFTELFEKVRVAAASEDEIRRKIEDAVLTLEAREKIIFSYGAVEALSASVSRYFGDAPYDKALHLVLEIAPRMKKEKRRVVSADDVLRMVAEMTGIATASASGDEREKLLHLEEAMRARVVGQDAAVVALADAMIRAREEVGSPTRPLGSFLFLGPTGVGKTETAKALAAVYFGDERAMIRFDMTEYQTDDALARLIGSFEGGKSGTLASALRDRPYGVLLLDEFEKTKREVLDLFLQILDEGFFSDMAGRRVNARNLIIIATSNAGSDFIWKMVEEHQDVSAGKDLLIDSLVERGLFKPELLNRFDGTILFHPLDDMALRAIAGLMLKKLSDRLLEKGVTLVVNDFLLDFLVKKGSDPKFGARPLQRALQDTIESVIARKMLEGKLAPGTLLELTSTDLGNEL